MKLPAVMCSSGHHREAIFVELVTQISLRGVNTAIGHYSFPFVIYTVLCYVTFKTTCQY